MTPRLEKCPRLLQIAASDPDRELVEQFRTGDRRAFDALVRRHQKGMRYHIKCLLGDDLEDGDAADDPALLEADDSEQDVESKASLVDELKKLVAQVSELSGA